MALQVYNVRTRRKEPFVPRDPRRVGLYVCGLTVYDHVHIGHARTYAAFEVVRRWLEHRHGAVHHVMNVTDVDDKIIDRAKETGVSPREHAAKWDATCRGELDRLGIRIPAGADYPHVTANVPGILRFTAGIVANGFGYVTAEGNVYFDVPGYDAHAALHMKDAEGRPCGYGSLSNRDFREMAAGTRKGVEGDKRHPADFALWKAGEPGDHPDANWDPAREEPDAAAAMRGIRPGRPGWHIECSLMSTQALGDTFDLHGGGQDLIFPHHENEVAQSQAKTGKAPFVNAWLHTGFLNVEGEKMSKSLGNFITLEETLGRLDARHGPGRGAEVLRFYFLQTHYRSKIDFTQQGLDEAGVALDRLDRMREALRQAAQDQSSRPEGLDARWEAAGDGALGSAAASLGVAFGVEMDDDFHTPGALAALFAFQREANKALDPAVGVGPQAARRALETLDWAGAQLTLFRRPPPATESGASVELLAAARAVAVPVPTGASAAAVMEALVAARAEARTGKDWRRSDAIRAAAREAGYLIEDTPGGARWRKT
ncbi:MAG: cysteine--tRNA ligase [Thermoplasmatota archaeon]|nr:cysteine--tRNA ligase [Halobacteriales archaeon]